MEPSLGALPAGMVWLVAESRQEAFQRGGQPGYHRVVRSMSLQRFQHRIIAEAGVSAKPQFSDLRRDGGETGLQQSGAALPCAGVPWAQFGVPEKGTVGLQAQQWVVATLAPVPRVVADLGAILLSEQGHHRAVQIEDQAGAALRQVDESLQQSIIGAV